MARGVSDDAPARYIRAERVIAMMAAFGRHRLETLGPARTVLLGVVAGAFITGGALLSVVLGAGVEPNGLQLLVMGLAFSAGFFFVVLSEAVLFTEANVVLPATLLQTRGSSLRVLRTMFVAAGFQHSPANMGYFALLMAQGQGPGWGPALVWNLAPAGLGNMLGGALLVALPFWYAFPPSGAPSAVPSNPPRMGLGR